MGQASQQEGNRMGKGERIAHQGCSAGYLDLQIEINLLGDPLACESSRNLL